MEDRDKTVLRRKKPLLLSLKEIRLTMQMQKLLRQKGLWDDSMVPDIVGEYDEKGQMSRFIDALMRDNPGGNAFEGVCEILDEMGYSWVSDELRADRLAEMGELIIEPYILKESGMWTHQNFGHSKLIPEEAKAKITYLLAVKTQAMKEACERRISSVTADMNRAMAFQMDEERKIKFLVDKIITFTKIHKTKLNEHVNEDGTTSVARGEDENKKPGLENLEMTIDSMLDMFARLNLESEKVNDERAKSYRVLGITKGTIALDIAIRSCLINAAEDIKKSQRQVDMTEEMASTLDNKLRTTQLVSVRDAEHKDKQLSYLEKQVRANKERSGELEREVIRLRKALADKQYELEKAQRDMIVLKKTRHLGYINPNWADIAAGDGDQVNGDQALVAVDDKTDDAKQNNKIKRKDSKMAMSRQDSKDSKSTTSSAGTVTGKRQPLSKRNSDMKGRKY